MPNNPIVEEVRRIRDAHAASFNYDLDAIFRDIKEREKASGRTYVRYPPRRLDAPKREQKGATESPQANEPPDAKSA